MNDPTYVIVGAGAAGVGAAEGLREAGFTGRIVLLGAEPVAPYRRAGLTNGFLRGDRAGATLAVHDPSWYERAGVELRSPAPVAALDRGRRQVRLTDGELVGYDRLLLATGGRADPLAVPGAHLAGVYRVRTLADVDGLRAALRRGGRVVVIGGTWAGLEVAAAARHYGARVTVLEAGPVPLHDTLGPEVAAVPADLHRGNGVEVRTGVQLAALAGDGGRVTGVVLADGSTLPARTVVVGDGDRPETTLAAQAGLPVDDGIVVDAGFRTVDPAVYAAGECASVPNSWLGGARSRVRDAVAAAEQGRAAGRAMAGADVPWDAMPRLRSEQYDTVFELFGALGPDGYDEVVLRGEDDGEDDETQESLVAFWLRGGEVRAALRVNAQAEGVEELVRVRAAADAGKLADPGVDLTSFL